MAFKSRYEIFHRKILDKGVVVDKGSASFNEEERFTLAFRTLSRDCGVALADSGKLAVALFCYQLLAIHYQLLTISHSTQLL
jgi:hypothetical protein